MRQPSLAELFVALVYAMRNNNVARVKKIRKMINASAPVARLP